MTDVLTTIHDWFAQPFNQEQSAMNWVLFVGLIVCAVFLWHMVLYLFITKGVEKL